MDVPAYRLTLRYPNGHGASRSEEWYLLGDELVTALDRLLDPDVLLRQLPWWRPELLEVRVFTPAEWDSEAF